MGIARITNGYLEQVRRQLDDVSDIEDPDLREAQVARLRKVAGTLEQHAVQETTISVNTNLSQKGQEAAIGQLAQATLKNLGWLPTDAMKADQAYGRAEAMVFAVPDAPKSINEVVQFLRESEIRSHLRTLTPSERMNAYLLAVQQDQTETVRAVRLAPGEPLISNDIRERADRERLEGMKPKEFTRLQSLNIVRKQLHELSDTLLRWLQGYGAEVKITASGLRSAQYLLAYGGEVKFPVPAGKLATNLT